MQATRHGAPPTLGSAYRGDMSIARYDAAADRYAAEFSDAADPVLAEPSTYWNRPPVAGP